MNTDKKYYAIVQQSFDFDHPEMKILGVTDNLEVVERNLFQIKNIVAELQDITFLFHNIQFNNPYPLIQYIPMPELTDHSKEGLREHSKNMNEWHSKNRENALEVKKARESHAEFIRDLFWKEFLELNANHMIPYFKVAIDGTMLCLTTKYSCGPDTQIEIVECDALV